MAKLKRTKAPTKERKMQWFAQGVLRHCERMGWEVPVWVGEALNG